MRVRLGLLALAATGVLATPALAATTATSATSAHGAGAATVTGAARSLTARIDALHLTHGARLVRAGEVSSSNWSGYATSRNGVKGVESLYTVPKASDLPPGFAATWTGIGGYGSSDLIQAGTTEDSVDGYYAWFELLPAGESEITGCAGDANCTVTPGDRMTIIIRTTATNTWSVQILDSGHWSWRTTLHYVSSESSAEWILEAPTVVTQTVLDNVHTQYFGAFNAWWDGKKYHTIGASDPIEIQLNDGLEAQPSALEANGTSFNDCAYPLGKACPTP